MLGIPYTIVTFFMLAAAFVTPFLGFCWFTVMTYLMPHIFSMFLFKIHVTRLLGIVTIGSILLRKDLLREARLFSSRQTRYLMAFYGVMWASLLTSIWKSASVAAAMDFIKILMAFFMVLALVNSVKRLRITIRFMIFSAIFFAVTSIQAYYQSGGGGRMYTPFYGTAFTDPNDLAMCFVFMLPFLFMGLFRKANFFLKTFNLAVIALFLWGIVLTQSRGGLLGLCAMFFVLFLRSKKKVLLSVLIIMALIGGWRLAPQEYRDRMLSIKTASQEDEAATSRLDAWKASVQMMTHRPFGVGAGNFGEGFVLYRPGGSTLHSGMRLVAHNMFLHIGGETGAPGMLLFLLFIGSGFSALTRVRKRMISVQTPEGHEISLLSDALYISLFGFCAAGMFLSQAYNFALYYLIAFSVVLERIAGEQELQVKTQGRKDIKTQKSLKAGTGRESRRWKSRAVSGNLEKENRS